MSPHLCIIVPGKEFYCDVQIAGQTLDLKGMLCLWQAGFHLTPGIFSLKKNSFCSQTKDPESQGLCRNSLVPPQAVRLVNQFRVLANEESNWWTAATCACLTSGCIMGSVQVIQLHQDGTIHSCLGQTVWCVSQHSVESVEEFPGDSPVQQEKKGVAGRIRATTQQWGTLSAPLCIGEQESNFTQPKCVCTFLPKQSKTPQSSTCGFHRWG